MAFQGDSIFWVELEKIVPNPYQPRREFNEEKLQELSESIRMYGVLQPLTVSRKEQSREDGTFFTEYELIAGERRLRASRLAGLFQVPVIIREGEDSEQEKLELAIIENLQREDLNAVDRALAFKQLADTFNLPHAQVAKKVGRSREYVSNSIRILNLPEYILDSLRRGDISEGHARTLLMLSDKPEELDTVFREILLKKLSVREVERIARKIAVDKVRKKEWKGTDPELMEIEKQFTETLGTRVQILKTDYGGKLTIDYFSNDDLEAMLIRLRSESSESEALSPNDERSAMDTLADATPMEAVGETPAPDAPAAPTPPPEPEPAPENHPEQVSEHAPEPTTVPEEERNETEDVTQAEPAPVTEPLRQDEGEVVHQEPESPLVDSDVGPGQTEHPVGSITEPAEPDEESPHVADEARDEKSDDGSLYSIRNFSI